MSDEPSRRELNRMNRPSGDHCGFAHCGPPIDVTCVGFEPSGSETHISSAPDRVDANASRLPSREKSGVSSSKVERTRGFVAGGFLPSSLSSQMFAFLNWAEYTSRPVLEMLTPAARSPNGRSSGSSPFPAELTPGAILHIRDRPRCPPAENTRPFPSGIQASPCIELARSRVIAFGEPAGVIPGESGST